MMRMSALFGQPNLVVAPICEGSQKRRYALIAWFCGVFALLLCAGCQRQPSAQTAGALAAQRGVAGDAVTASAGKPVKSGKSVKSGRPVKSGKPRTAEPTVGHATQSSANKTPKKNARAQRRSDRPPAKAVAAWMRQLHEAASGAAGDVLGVTVDKEVYRVTMAAGTSPRQIETVYVSRRGDMLLENAINLQARLYQLKADKRFAECLRAAKVELYITLADKASKAMFRRIGRFAHLISVDCGGRGKARCAKLKLTQVPAVSVRGVMSVGPRSVAWFESTTGCKLSR